MKKIILLGNEGRRKDFFLKAGEDLNREIVFLPLFSEKILDYENQSDYIVKIDPISFNTSDYSDLENEMKKYFDYLSLLEKTDFDFFNSPSSIKNTLNKKTMKDILIENNINMSESINLDSYDVACLLDTLKSKGLSNVFIKPRFGSGAVGILALKCNFKLNDFSLFTSLSKRDGNYYNTKKLRNIRDREIIFDLLSRILVDKPIIEKWIEKKRYGTKSFDLRVLVNFNRVDFIVGRTSNGPITNLHLNDGAVDFKDLDIDENTYENIINISKEAVNSFSGLNYGGVDVLLTPKNQVYVIEVNGQGDLIYKDIFDKNLIYKRQIERILL